MLEPATHRPGTVLGGKFKIERVLGAGGMGAVYEVTHTVTRHRRALKLLHARMAANDEVVERFLREASAAGRIGDPHIVETFDGGHLASGEPYVLLELLEGRSLAERLKGTAGLAVPEALEIVAQACDGTEAANRAGIIHRDLKPDNLFLCERGGQPFVKLLDFGVSRFDPQTSLDKATVGGGLIGTPFYMAPEQMRGDKDLDARADVYALGVILWECLTNTLPYAARDVVRLVGEVMADDEPRLERVRPDLPPALVELVAHAMKKKRELRIGSAAELGQGLRALLSAIVPDGGPGASALAATGLADTGVAIVSTPGERGADPLAATSAPGAQAGPVRPVRVSTGDPRVDEVALTVAPAPGSTPMSVSTPTPLSAPATKRAAGELDLEAPKGEPASGEGSLSASESAQGEMTLAPNRSGGTLFAVGLVLSVVIGLVIAALPATDPSSGTSSAALATDPGVGVGATATGRADVRPELGAPPTGQPASARETVAPPSADLAMSAASSPPPVSARSTVTPRAPTSRPSAKPSSTYGSKGEFPGG